MFHRVLVSSCLLLFTLVQAPLTASAQQQTNGTSQNALAELEASINQMVGSHNRLIGACAILGIHKNKGIHKDKDYAMICDPEDIAQAMERARAYYDRDDFAAARRETDYINRRRIAILAALKNEVLPSLRQQLSAAKAAQPAVEKAVRQLEAQEKKLEAAYDRLDEQHDRLVDYSQRHTVGSGNSELQARIDAIEEQMKSVSEAQRDVYHDRKQAASNLAELQKAIAAIQKQIDELSSL